MFRYTFQLIFLLTISVGFQNGFSQKPAANPYNMIDTVLAHLKTAKEDDRKAGMFLRLSVLYKNTGQYEKGLAASTESIKVSEKTGDKKRLAAGYNMRGVINKNIGNYAEAIRNYDISLEITKETNDKVAIAGINSNMANIYSIQGKHSEALKRTEAALKIYKELGAKDGMGICYNNMGETYIEQGNYVEALKHLLEAYNIFQEMKYHSGMGAAYSNIGDIHRYQGNYAEGLKYHFASLKFYEEAKDQPALVGAYISLGNVYLAQLNFEEGLKYYRSSLKIAQETGDKLGVADAMNNIGTVYEKQKKYWEALKMHSDALAIHKELENKSGIATSLNNMGLVYQAQKNYPDALTNLVAALTLSEEIGEKNAIADSYNNIGLLLISQAAVEKGSTAQKKYIAAIDYFNRSYLLGHSIGAKKIVSDAYRGMSHAYAAMKQFDNAYKYTNLSFDIKDSLLNNENTKKMEQLRLQYEIEKAQAEEKSKQENEKKLLQLAFSKKEDSLKYRQSLTEEELLIQTLMAKESGQALRIKQTLLDLSNHKMQINKLAHLKTEAELTAAQNQRAQKQNELNLANNERALQASQLRLQQSNLHLKESELSAEKKQRQVYLGGIVFILLSFSLLFYNIKSRQRSNAAIAVEKQKVEKAISQHKMAELELQSLRTQLNPHFMFNSLNAIQELILLEENEKSHIYLSRFAKLLRILLENAEKPFISLQKEIDFLQLYLGLENLRIPNLQYSFSVDPSINQDEIVIPNMMLQPYIENAIWHGLSHKDSEKQLKIRIFMNGENIIYEVEDNGIGRKRSSEINGLYRRNHTSKGMVLLQKRFKLLNEEYNTTIHTTTEDVIKENSVGGTVVKIKVPKDFSSQIQFT